MKGKRQGRPSLPPREKRQKVTLMLTPEETERLRREYAGHSVGFSVFCREKLLNREAVSLSKPLDGGIRRQLTDLLKFSGSLLLLAQKTRDHAPVSEDFRLMASQLKQIVQRAHYTVNEITYSQSLVFDLYRISLKMGAIIGVFLHNCPEDDQVRELDDYHQQMKEALQTYLDRFQLKTNAHDR